MSRGIEPGCLAVIVRPYLDEAQIGRPVTVVRIGIGYERIKTRGVGFADTSGTGGPAWLCEASGPEFPCFVGQEFLRRIDDGGLADTTDTPTTVEDGVAYG